MLLFVSSMSGILDMELLQRKYLIRVEKKLNKTSKGVLNPAVLEMFLLSKQEIFHVGISSLVAYLVFGKEMSLMS